MQKSKVKSVQETKNNIGDLEKLKFLFDSLSDNEKSQFLESVSSGNSNFNSTIKGISNRTRILVKDFLSKKKNFTKVKLSGSTDEKIIEEKYSLDDVINLTVSSITENKEIAKKHIEQISKSISKTFKVDEIYFLELFNDYFSDFYYLFYTDESTDFKKFLPDGYDFKDFSSEKAANSYEAYVLSMVTTDEYVDIVLKLQRIFKAFFPLKDDSRIDMFIQKAKLPVLLSSYMKIMHDENKKFN